MTAPSQTGNPFLTTNLQELASVSMIRGKHSIKFGYELTHMHGWTDGLFTSEFNYHADQTADPQNAADTGSPWPPTSWESGRRNPERRRNGSYMAGTNHAAYIQDDIKLKSNLTVNLVCVTNRPVARGSSQPSVGIRLHAGQVRVGRIQSVCESGFQHQ